MFVAAGMSVALAVAASWIVAAGSAATAAPADRWSQARVEAALARFDSWVDRYLASPADKAAPVAEEGVALARQRRLALLQLAESDPRQVLARALPPSTLKRLPPAVQENSESYLDACGSSFDLEASDDFSDPEAPVTRFRRTLTVGSRTYEAQVFGRRLGVQSKAIHANGVAIGDTVVLYESPFRRLDPQEAAADAEARAQCARLGGSCVAVKVGATTVVFPDEAALRRHEAALARDEAAKDPEQPAGPAEARDPIHDHGDGPDLQSAWTTGDKTVLYIRVDFSDRPGDPVAAEAVQATVDNVVNQYYRDASYNQTSLKATVTPLIRMPRTAAEYEAGGDGPILSDGQAGAKAAGFDSANFNLFIVAFPRMSFGYSGKARVGRAGVWLNGSFGAGVTAHELGHNYGLRHANFWQFTDGDPISPAGTNLEYGNVFDVMGRGGAPRGIFNAWFKTLLDWLPPAGFAAVSASGTYSIQPIDDPAMSGLRALRIVKDATKNYWVEFRTRHTGNRWAMNGAILNWGYNRNTGSHLIDTTPTTASRDDSPILVGSTFSDAVAGIHITPISRSAAPPSMDVVVKLGAFPGNSPPIAALVASAPSVSRNSPVTLTVNASDVDGDALAYHWVFDDNSFASNSASITKSWSSEGVKSVQCIVTDMVGGTTTVSTTVTVGPPTAFRISGTVTSNGAPLAGVVVGDGSRSATTNAAGAYTIDGVPNGAYTLTPRLAGFAFTPATRRVTVSGNDVRRRNFTANRLPQ